MAKLLAEWFWTDRWTGSSAFLLDMEARGLYREMLTQAWRRGAKLPNDPEAIQRATGATKKEWARAWPKVQRFWRIDGDDLVNDTQVRVYAEAQGVALRASERGRKGAQARAQALAQALAQAHTQALAPAVVQARPEPQPPSPSLTQEPKTHSHARAKNLAFAGDVLQVPKFLDEEFVRRLNGQYFDLTSFYVSLDAGLKQSGEPWDLVWIREQFAEHAPAPERRKKDAPITALERSQAAQIRRSWNYCQHEPKCENYELCIEEIIYSRRAKAQGAA